MGAASSSDMVFSRFRLVPDRGELLADGEPVALRPKSFEVLRYLAERAGQLVGKDELLQAVWPKVVVSDDSLTRCISDIRLALQDREQVVIKTVPRRGYMLDAAVTHHARSSGPAAEASRSRPAWWISVAGLVALVALGVMLAAARIGGPTEARPPVVAVLPFEVAPDHPDRLVHDAFAGDLRTALSRFSQVQVITGQSSARAVASGGTVPQILARLRADYALSGSVQRDGSALRIDMQLASGASDTQIWAGTFVQPLEAWPGVRDEILRAVVTRLVSRIERQELVRAPVSASATTTPYRAILEAEDRLRSGQGHERGASVARARQLFEQALTVDPRSARALHGAALTYVTAYLEPLQGADLEREYQNPAAADRALALARRAVTADAEVAEAWATLGRILFWKGQRPESLAAFGRAFALNPNLVEPRYALVLIHEGESERAIEILQRMIRLDPLYAPYMAFVMGKAHAVAGRYAEAVRWLSISTSQLPEHRPSHVWLAASAAGLGQMEKAQAAAGRVRELDATFAVERFVADAAFASGADAARARTNLLRAGLTP